MNHIEQRLLDAAKQFPRLIHVLVEWPTASKKPTLPLRYRDSADRSGSIWADSYKKGWETEHWLIRDGRESWNVGDAEKELKTLINQPLESWLLSLHAGAPRLRPPELALVGKQLIKFKKDERRGRYSIVKDVFLASAARIDAEQRTLPNGKAVGRPPEDDRNDMLIWVANAYCGGNRSRAARDYLRQVKRVNDDEIDQQTKSLVSAMRRFEKKPAKGD